MEQPKLEAIKLTVAEADSILQYLAVQPYKEVVQLIDMIQKAERIFAETL